MINMSTPNTINAAHNRRNSRCSPSRTMIHVIANPKPASSESASASSANLPPRSASGCGGFKKTRKGRPPSGKNIGGGGAAVPSQCGIRIGSCSQNGVTIIDNATPARMSRPTSGSRCRPRSSRFHDTRKRGCRRRADDSNARYSTQVAAASASDLPIATLNWIHSVKRDAT